MEWSHRLLGEGPRLVDLAEVKDYYHYYDYDYDYDYDHDY